MTTFKQWKHLPPSLKDESRIVTFQPRRPPQEPPYFSVFTLRTWDLVLLRRSRFCRRSSKCSGAICPRLSTPSVPWGRSAPPQVTDKRRRTWRWSCSPETTDFFRDGTRATPAGLPNQQLQPPRFSSEPDLWRHVQMRAVGCSIGLTFEGNNCQKSLILEHKSCFYCRVDSLMSLYQRPSFQSEYY